MRAVTRTTLDYSRLTLLIPLPPFPSVAKSRGDLDSSSGNDVSLPLPLLDMVGSVAAGYAAGVKNTRDVRVVGW